jgi:ThiF family/Prokaryotic homologs of the JAB domain
VRHTLTLLGHHERQLRELLLTEDGRENVAYVLCRIARVSADPWTGEPETRFISREIVRVDDADVYERSPSHVTWQPNTLHRLLPRCNSEGLVIVLAHSHPTGFPDPSPQDDRNEPELFEYGWVRDGDDVPFSSIVLSENTIRGRTWYGWSRTSFPLDVVRVIGDRFQFHGRESADRSNSAFARQVLAFGRALDERLRSLRVTVVGVGGTGSATATLLARLGIGRLALIDPDLVESSNLNRLHGARQADADAGRPKVDVVSRMIAELGLGISVRAFHEYLDATECRDVLRSSDIVFGCTDDHDGRLYLNRLAYFYGIPVIDMGLTILLDKSVVAAPPVLAHLIGRVTVLAPETSCIVCRDVVNSEIAGGEVLRRTEPAKYARLKAEAYVVGEGNPRPAIVTFTTETATMAVNELLQRIGNFKGTSTDHRLRDFLDSRDMTFPTQSEAACKFCGSGQHAGKADVEPFLERHK